MWFKAQYHLLSKKKKTRNGHGEYGGCDSRHNITYFLRRRRNGHGEHRMWFKHNITYPLRKKKEKTGNGHGEHGGCDSKHNITHKLQFRCKWWPQIICKIHFIISNTYQLWNEIFTWAKSSYA